MPKSEQFFFYGFVVIGVIVAMIVGMSILFKDRPEAGVAMTKVMFYALTVIWAICWMTALAYSYLEKIGASS